MIASSDSRDGTTETNSSCHPRSVRPAGRTPGRVVPLSTGESAVRTLVVEALARRCSARPSLASLPRSDALVAPCLRGYLPAVGA